MILPIVKFPNPILRAETEPVVFPLSKEMKKLTADMIETVKAAQGVGLAAPQVNRNVKLIIINLEHLKIPPFPLYNPRVKKKSGKKLEIEEGCLSIPGVFGQIKRPKQIIIEAQNANGEAVEITDDGWVSRVAQHEIDHINGVLIIDLIKKYTKGGEMVKEWKKKKIL